MAVADGVVRYARQKPDWQLRGQGPWFFALDLESLRRCDALIARIENDEEAQFCASLGIPVVDIAGSSSLKLFNQVRNDDYQTGVAAGNYLKALGTKHFGWCGVDGVHWARERLIGYNAACGHKSDNLPMFSRPLSWWRQLYERSPELEAWLHSLPKPIALFCCNDLSAMKVELACQNLDLGIPSEILVLGVDNETLLCELASPSISSIQPDCRTIGYQASKMLDDLLTNPDGGRRIQRIAPGPVSERESTHMVQCEDDHVVQALLLIKKEATNNLTAEQVAAHASICRRSLEIRFRTYRGRSIWEEICEQKLQQACLLLEHSDRTVADISQSCGFASVNRFYMLFKRRYSETPQVWRKRKTAF